MDESWRFRSIHGNLCPVCSVSHFPFCSQSHPYDRNGYVAGENFRRFRPEIHPPAFHRSFPDPVFSDHRPPPLPMSPFPIPSAARDPLPPLPFYSSSQRFLQEEFLEEENFRKRMRVEDPIPFQPFDRVALDNERRLNLIRDHGQQTAGPIEGDTWNHQRIVGIDHNLGSQHGRAGPILHREPAFSQEIPRPRSIERFLPQERKDFHSGEFDASRSGALNPQSEEQLYRRNDQFESSWQPARSYNYSDYPERPDNYRVQGPQEQFLNDGPQQASYPIPDYDRHQIHSTESSSYSLPKQTQYPHSESFQVNHEKESFYSTYGTMRQPLEDKVDLQNHYYELKPPYTGVIQKPFESQVHSLVEQPGSISINQQGGYPPLHVENKNYRFDASTAAPVHTSQPYPPLSPQPPMPPNPELSSSHFGVSSPIPHPPSMLSTVPPSTSATALVPSGGRSLSEPHSSSHANFYSEQPVYTSTRIATEGISSVCHTSSKEYVEGKERAFSLGHSVKDKYTVIDARHLFRQPHRASRPDHIVVILRGLPGSGKSYLARALRDLEVETGGAAPRIHAIDDYFMTEVEKKVEDNEGSKSSSSARSKKQTTKKVIEYCYEPEMEEVYRSSMLKAFKKTLDDGSFTFIIVDDRNLRIADFAQFWAIAKRSGYEVYLLEATYKDPTGCAARNVHGFTVDEIQKMAEQWEEAPPLYLQLDMQSLFGGDDLSEHSILEVDMDTDDAACDEGEAHKLKQREDHKMIEPNLLDHEPDGGPEKIGERWNAEDEEEPTGVKKLGKSKWSKDVDEDVENSDGAEGSLSALSGLMQAYGKSEKSVHWGDLVDQSGFSIGAARKQNRSSLVIGPGSGYNLGSNPLPNEVDIVETAGRSNVHESKRRFSEQLRAERESFKAVFDRRRQRIAGRWDTEDE